MEYQATHTQALLNQSYTFQSVSGKNTSFQSSINNMPFYFRSDDSLSRNHLCVHAGGKITYTVPVKYTQEKLPYTLILFITQGEASITFRGHTQILSEHDIVLLPSDNSLLFSTTHTPFSYHVYYLSGTVCQDFYPHLCTEHGFYQKNHSADSILWRLFSSIEALLPSESPLASLHMSAMFHLFFSALADANEQEILHARFPKHVAEMKQILDSDYQNPHPLEELEQTIGINKYRLCRDFSKHIGISPVQYLTQVRMREAKHLLRFTTLTIREVGSAVGIDNTTHFINLFKKNAGITPLQFRQAHSH